MKTNATTIWRKIAVFTLALTLMYGSSALIGKDKGASVITASAETLQDTENVEIEGCEHGTLGAELAEDDTAVLITAEPDEGYKVKGVYVNGDQVAINDNGQYLVAYTGEKLVISAEFVEDVEMNVEIKGCDHGKLGAELAEDDTAILITAEPDAGYMVKAVYVNGDQVAINDNGEYLVAYTGEKLVISAEFVPVSKTDETDSTTSAKDDSKPVSKKDSSNPHTGAASVIAALTAVGGAAIVVSKKRK